MLTYAYVVAQWMQSEDILFFKKELRIFFLNVHVILTYQRTMQCKEKHIFKCNLLRQRKVYSEKLGKLIKYIAWRRIPGKSRKNWYPTQLKICEIIKWLNMLKGQGHEILFG